MTATPLRTPRTVAAAMTRPVVTVGAGALIKDVISQMVKHSVSMLPVLDGTGRVAGVITSADVLARVSGDRGTVPRGHRLTAPREQFRKETARYARDLMTCPAISIRPTQSIRAAAERMARARVRFLVVIDDDRRLLGIVSKRDLLASFVRPDAEIRAEIEHDVIGAALLLEPYTVEVDVADGIVTLAGYVHAAELLSPLLDAIREVPGVIAIEDRRLRTPASGEQRT